MLSFAHARGLNIRGKRLNALRFLDENGSPLPWEGARVEGETLVLPACPGAVTLAFADTDYYEVNLYNDAGIPALPFRAELG